MYIEGDMFNIASRVKDIDPALSLSLDKRRGKYQIKRENRHVMFVEPGQLHAGVLTQLRKNDLARRRLQDYIIELERSEDEAEKRKARNLSNQIESITLDNYDKIVGIPHFSCGTWGGN